MFHGIRSIRTASVVAMLIALVGCNGSETEYGGSTAGTNSTSAEHTDADHAHPSEGPHHGSLIEFGNEEYHGEFLHDDESITIYILDSGATEQVPIEAESITLNVTHDGTPSTHELAASPDESDPEGTSSRFVLTDAAVVEMIDAEGSTARLSAMIDGTPYSGNIVHSHEGHDHSHE